MMFTTYDRDNDCRSSRNCAAWIGGGFWLDACVLAEVNAPHPNRHVDFSWRGLPGGRGLQSSRMWLLCK